MQERQLARVDPCRLRRELGFSSLGGGAATRAGTVVVLGTFAFVGFRLLENANQRRATVP